MKQKEAFINAFPSDTFFFLKNVTKGIRDMKEGGISARKVGLL